jgi:hypothetical protein
MEGINQSNLHLLIPGKVMWLAEYLREDYGLTLKQSLGRIYHSELYKKLSTESTKYWHLGPVDLYSELKTELLSLDHKGNMPSSDYTGKSAGVGKK